MLDLIKLSKASTNLKEKETYENELAILQLNVQMGRSWFDSSPIESSLLYTHS